MKMFRLHVRTYYANMECTTYLLLQLTNWFRILHDAVYCYFASVGNTRRKTLTKHTVNAACCNGGQRFTVDKICYELVLKFNRPPFFGKRK